MTLGFSVLDNLKFCGSVSIKSSCLIIYRYNKILNSEEIEEQIISDYMNVCVCLLLIFHNSFPAFNKMTVWDKDLIGMIKDYEAKIGCTHQ